MSTETNDVRREELLRRADVRWRRLTISIASVFFLGVFLLVFRFTADPVTLMRINHSVGLSWLGPSIGLAFAIGIVALMLMYLQTGFSRQNFAHSYLERAGIAAPPTPALPLEAAVMEPGTISGEGKRQQRQRLAAGETHAIVSRLKGEVRHLTFRANVNLIIGIAITAAGIGALFYFVSKMQPLPERQLAWRFVEHFVPRLSLVIFIELFAYFFLRLYRDCLGDIKYYQNEMTNAQSRRLAVLLSATAPSHEPIQSVIDKLMDTERNLVLKRGETTPDLKKSEIEHAAALEIVKEISRIVNAAPSKAKE